MLNKCLLLCCRDCSLLSKSKFLGEGVGITFRSSIGSTDPLPNPLIFDIENYEGVVVEISFLDADNSALAPYELVSSILGTDCVKATCCV